MVLPRGAAVALLAWATSLAAYLNTLCPTVYVEGSGELIGAAYLLGTPHPSGYPLYCLLGRLCTLLLPFGSPAHQINLFTALTAAAAVGVLGGLLHRRGLHPAVAWGASLAFGFSGTFWSQAVIAEVYGMAMLGAVLLLWAGAVTAEDRGEEAWLGLAYLAGLGLTLHLSLVLLWPAVALLVGRRRPELWRDGGALGRGLAVFALGFSPVVYLFIRNGEGPAFHWGTISSAGQWWDHLSGALYRDSFFSLPAAAMWLNLQRWARQLLAEFHPVLVPLALWGVWTGFRRDRQLWWLVMGALTANLVVALNYHRDPNGIAVFFLISILACAFFLAWGLEDLWVRWRPNAWLPWLGGTVVGLAVLATHLAGSDRSEVRVAHQYGSDILAGLPENAILLAEGDDAAFILDYLQRLEGLRPDVRLVNRMGRGRDLLVGAELELGPVQGRRLRAQREAELVADSERPLHFLHARRLPVEGYQLVPAGLTYRVWPVGRVLPATPLGQVPSVPLAHGAPLDPWVRKLQANYAFMRGEGLLAQSDSAAALEAYREAARVAHDSRSLRFNVALIMMRHNRLEDAWSNAAAAVALDPWNPEVLRLQAQIRIREGRRAEAELLLKKAVELGGAP